MRTALALGLGLGALIVGGGIAYAAAGASKPAATPATAASFNVNTAIPVTPGSSITIPVGSGLAVQNTGGTQVTTTNAAVVAPSQPATANGFVAITTGTATLQIPPNSNNPSGATIAVTVVTSTGGAIGSSNPAAPASSSSSSSSSAGASLPSATTVSANLPAGSPQGLVSSGSTSSGWAQHITITPNVAGILYQGFYGDVITISLPPGAHWRATSSSMGPASGIDDFVFTLIEDITVVLSYTDASGANQGTTLAFELGGVFEPTTQIASGDYVIFALAQSDYQATFAGIAAAIQSPPVGTALGQQGQTIASAEAALGTSPTEEQFLSWFFLVGPWASTWALDPHSVAFFLPAAALPSWWPSADSGAASEFHVLARYTGAGAAVSALPFPVTAYTRVA